MQDRTLYARLLGIEDPWRVTEVTPAPLAGVGVVLFVIYVLPGMVEKCDTDDFFRADEDVEVGLY